MIALWIILIVAVVIVLWIVAVYNRFINLRNGIESTFNQISVALKKRLDMIGQIVDSTKGMMKFEKSTLTEVTKLRQAGKGSITPAKADQLLAATNKLAGSIAVQVEAYPKLTSNENVKQLISSVQEMEDEISRLRYTYNNTIQEFNTKRETIPSSIVAGMFGFNKKKYLEMKESAAELEKRPDTKL